MFGMNTMSGAVAPLRKYEAFTELLTGFQRIGFEPAGQGLPQRLRNFAIRFYFLAYISDFRHYLIKFFIIINGIEEIDKTGISARKRGVEALQLGMF